MVYTALLTNERRNEEQLTVSEYVNLRNRDQWNKAILDALVTFDRICKEHDIPWFLEGGSFLGAIRHRGFIPWDNDIDVSLLEEDYKKLREVYRAGGFPKHYLLQDNEINPHYPTDFTRIVDESGTTLLKATEFCDTPPGIFLLDVFRLVPLPDDEKERAAAIVRFCVLGELMHPFKRRCGRRSKEFWTEYHCALHEIESEGRDAVLKRRKKEFFSNDNTNSEWVLPSGSGPHNGYPLKRRSWYQQPATRVLFEGHKFPIPSTPYSALRHHYGESFRHFPRSSEKWSHRRANGNIPAKVIMEDYLRLFDQEKVTSDLTHAKTERMKLTELRHAYSTPVYQLRAQLTLLKMRDEFEKAPKNSADLVWTALRSAPPESEALFFKAFGKEGDPQYSVIAGFISTLFDGKHRYWGLTTPIEDDERIICTGFLLLSRKPYWEAKRLLDLTSGNDDEPKNASASERIEQIYTALQDIDDLLLAMDENRFSDADKLFSRTEAVFPGLLEIAQARLWLAVCAQEKREGCENRQLSKCQAALVARQFNDDGDVLSYYGDYLWVQGEKKEAKKIYKEAKSKTLNGMTLLHIEDRLAGGVND